MQWREFKLGDLDADCDSTIHENFCCRCNEKIYALIEDEILNKILFRKYIFDELIRVKYFFTSIFLMD